MKLEPIVDQFMDNVTQFFEDALDSIDFEQLRDAAKQIEEARNRTHRRLMSLQNALIAKAFAHKGDMK
jgi:DNA-binding MurR/RpiR family transcriptional regulator